MPLFYSYVPQTDSYSVAAGSCQIGTVVIPSTHNGPSGIRPVNVIGVAAFEGCGQITNIIIPNSIIDIRSRAFNNCNVLRNVIIPNSVTGLGEFNTFNGCFSLTGLTIGNSVTSIEYRGFRNCQSLQKITFEPNSSLKSIGFEAFNGCISLTGITIPNSVTSIGSISFQNCTSLKSVTFEPNSNLNFIDNSAFIDLKNLTKITIPSGVTGIEDRAFERCSNLTGVTFEPNSNLKSIGYVTFGLCTGLVGFTIPKSVTSIRGSFQNCSNLTSVAFEPNSNLTNIVSAFSTCPKLSSIIIPSGVTGIGDNTFNSCAGLTSITFEPISKLRSIGSNAFNFCSKLPSIIIPNSVNSIGTFGFYSCTGLTSITIPSSMANIGNSAFSSCSNLARVNFLGNAPTLGTNVFLNTNVNLKIYRWKNFVTGWTSTLGGITVVLYSDNVIKSGGTGKLITSIYNSDALKYIQLIESLTSPNNPITQDSKNKINSFIKQIKQIVPWNNFTAWTFIRGQNAFPYVNLNSTDNRYNGIVKTFGGLGGGEVISANSSTSNGDEGLSFSSPAGVLSISPSSFFTSVKSIFGVFKPKGNYYYIGTIDQNIFSVGGGSGPISYTYSSLYYRLDAVYSRITRNSILDIQTSNTSVFNLDFYKSLGTVFDANSTSNYSNGIKQFTASPLSVPNASLFSRVSIGGGIVDNGTIPFVFVSDLVLTNAQMLAIHNIYKSTLGANLINSQL